MGVTRVGEKKENKNFKILPAEGKIRAENTARQKNCDEKCHRAHKKR